MDRRAFIERLVPEVAHNASVVRIEEERDVVRVVIAGTTGVEAGCELRRETVEAAQDDARARLSVTTALKACADRAVAPVPYGRA